jgi:spermidine synthase
MPLHRPLAVRRPQLSTLLAVAAAASTALAPHGCRGVEADLDNFAGRLEFEGTSDYSHIRVRRRGNLRSLLFVRDTGEEALESRIDLRRPAELQFEYLKYLFTSYLFREKPSDVLIVGLGGGGMVHFLKLVDPALRVDVVEIDPLVVKLADEYFGVRNGGNVTIITADGLDFIANAKKQYDVIYLDAFLKPSAGTDSTGVPLSLRTRQFYEQMQQKLKPGGLAAFNINPHENIEEDVRTIAEAFPQAYQFPLTQYEGLVVVASTDPVRLKRAGLIPRARALDARFDTSIRFQQMARRMRE